MLSLIHMCICVRACVVRACVVHAIACIACTVCVHGVCVCIRACAHVVLGCHACLAQRRFEYSGTRYHFHNILEFIFATLFLVHSPATLCGLFPQHSLVYFRATFFNLFLCNILSLFRHFSHCPHHLQWHVCLSTAAPFHCTSTHSRRLYL